MRASAGFVLASFLSSGCIFLYEPANEQAGGSAQGGASQGGAAPGGAGQGGSAVATGGMGGGGGMGGCPLFPAPPDCSPSPLPTFPAVITETTGPVPLGPVALSKENVFFAANTAVYRFDKATLDGILIADVPQVVGDIEVIGGEAFVSPQANKMHRCNTQGCSPLMDEVGAWNKLVRVPTNVTPLLAMHNPEATLYRLTTEGAITATGHSVGATWAGYDVDALDEQNLAFSAWGAGGNPNAGIVYRSFMPSIDHQTWSPQAMHAGAIALRGDKTLFVMVGDLASERLFEWAPGDVDAKLSPLDAKLKSVPQASPLKYNPETDVLYAVANTDSGVTLAACRCGTCTLSDASCSLIGGIDVERDPCAEHHGAAYFTCDNKLVRWDYPSPQ